MKCFKKEHYPLPDQATAAFEAASEQVRPDRSGMGLMQMAPVAGQQLLEPVPWLLCSASPFLSSFCHHCLRKLVSSSNVGLQGDVCALLQGFSSDDELQRAQRELVSATQAAAGSGPSARASAFAAPGIQRGDASDVGQARDLLGKVVFL